MLRRHTVLHVRVLLVRFPQSSWYVERMEPPSNESRGKFLRSIRRRKRVRDIKWTGAHSSRFLRSSSRDLRPRTFRQWTCACHPSDDTSARSLPPLSLSRNLFDVLLLLFSGSSTGFLSFFVELIRTGASLPNKELKEIEAKTYWRQTRREQPFFSYFLCFRQKTEMCLSGTPVVVQCRV